MIMNERLLRNTIRRLLEEGPVNEIKLSNKHFPGWSQSDPSGKRRQSRKKGTENALRAGPDQQQWGTFFVASDTKFYPKNFSKDQKIGSIPLPAQTSIKVLAQDYKTVVSDNGSFDALGTGYGKKVLKVEIQNLPDGSPPGTSNVGYVPFEQVHTSAGEDAAVSLSSDKELGYAAEYAVKHAILIATGNSSPEDIWPDVLGANEKLRVINDKVKAGGASEDDFKAVEDFKQSYGNMVRAAINAVRQSEIKWVLEPDGEEIPDYLLPSVATEDTAPVDINLASADIHVKLGSDRLGGINADRKSIKPVAKESGDKSGSKKVSPDDVHQKLDKAVEVGTPAAIANKAFSDVHRLAQEMSPNPMDYPIKGNLKKAKQQILNDQEPGGLREKFISSLESNNFSTAVTDAIEPFLFSGRRRGVDTYYFKFDHAGENNFKLEIERMAIPDNVELEAVLNTTPGKSGKVATGQLYKIVDKNSPDNVYMNLEIRTDRGPQIHRGPMFGGADGKPGLAEIIALGEGIVSKENSEHKLIREYVREMLTEAFTKTDEDRIGVLTRKEIDTAWKKELEKKVQTMLDKQVKNAYQNNDFYKVVGKIWKELMKVYAEEQFQQARRFSRYDVPLARIKP